MNKKKGGKPGLSWRAIAKMYGVPNHAYVLKWAKQGIVPSNLEVCYRMGLKQPPMLGPKPPPPRFELAVRAMAAETRKIMRVRKVKP